MALSALASPQTQPSAPALPSNGIMDASGQYLIVPPGTQLSPGGSTPAMLAVFPDGKQTIVPATTWPAYYRVGGDNGAFQDFDQSGQPLKTAPGAPPFSLQAGTKLYDPTTGALAGEVSSGLPGNASQAFFEAALAVAGGAAAGAYGLGGAAAGGAGAATPVAGDLGAELAGATSYGAGGGGLAAGAGAGAGGYDLTGNLANLAANPANVQVAGDASGIGAVGGAGTAGAGAAGGGALGGNLDALAASGQFGAGATGLAGSEVGTIAGGGAGLAGAAGAGAGAGSGAPAAVDTLGVGGDGYAGAGGIAANGGVGATTAATTAGTGTALSRILAGTGTAADYASVGLQALPGVLGAVGSSEQASALSNLAQQQFAVGAPSRARYEASMTPGFDPTTIPGYSGALASTSQAVLSKLSATGGNPYGNPGGLISANQQIVNGTALPAVENYQNQNAATGGYGAFNTAANGTATAAIGANSGVLSALGSAASSVVNPPQTLADLLKQYGLGSSASNSSTMANNASSLT